MSQGWIKLYRCLLTSDLWTKASDKGKIILITLLLRAAHAPTVWPIKSERTQKTIKNVALGPGQLFASYRQLAKEFDVTVQQITTELSRLENLKVIALSKKNRYGTLITFLDWERYQGYTRNQIGTMTQIQTPPNVDSKPFSPGNTDFPKTQNQTELQSRFQTYNKNIYSLINNNTNKKELNNQSYIEAGNDPEFRDAIDLYNNLYPNKAQQLSEEETYCLQCIAAMLGGGWVRKAAYELKAAAKEKTIRRPGKYFLGIIHNWMANGVPNDSKGRAQELFDYYRQEGVV
ncbi:MAG: hypothetical protein ACI3WU_00555 [Phascolarctobacterium sp.]